MSKSPSVDHAAVLLRFSRALVAGDFAAAHSLLEDPLSSELSPEQLRMHFQQMTDYWSGPAQRTEIMNALTEWPDRQHDDAGWAYAAILGPDFSEAVAGVVTKRGRIRKLEWGRP